MLHTMFIKTIRDARAPAFTRRHLTAPDRTGPHEGLVVARWCTGHHDPHNAIVLCVFQHSELCVITRWSRAACSSRLGKTKAKPRYRGGALPQPGGAPVTIQLML